VNKLRASALAALAVGYFGVAVVVGCARAGTGLEVAQAEVDICAARAEFKVAQALTSGLVDAGLLEAGAARALDTADDSRAKLERAADALCAKRGDAGP
jgi:hypothetical protein